jgi:glycerate 2-kinase
MALQLAEHRQHIQSLIGAALAAADPADAVRRTLRREGRRLTAGSLAYSLDEGRVFIIGAGKASLAMGTAAAEVLGKLLAGGVLIAKRGESSPGRRRPPQLPAGVRVFYAGHPVSDATSVEATSAALALLQDVGPGDLVLCLISGGASALMTQPVIPLADWRHLIDVLLASGCTINELNAVRKRLDLIKGGGLARSAAPAACLSLILSDVVGNPLDVIGSGPTVPNPDPPRLARTVLDRYEVVENLPESTWQTIDEALVSAEAESTQAPPAAADNLIIGDVRRSAEAAVAAAGRLGFSARLLTAHLEGEAREVGRVVAALAKDAPSGACLVLGGETTVTLRGKGLGGRNQELALAAAVALDGWPNVVLAAFATDGDDGPTTAAGAIATGQSVAEARQAGLDPLDYLDRNDSYHFFDRLGGLIETGPTGTNVNDLVFILSYPPLI